MKKTVVYYAELNNVLSNSPVNLYDHAKNFFDCNNNPLLLRCPSFLQSIQNTFVIKSSADFSFYYNKTTNGTDYTLHTDTLTFEDSRSKNFFREKCVQKGSNGLVSLYLPYFIFFSENPIVVELLPPYFHNNFFSKNISVIPGKLDISKHFRALEVPLYISSNCKVSIKENDPLMYVNFTNVTPDTKVELKRFYFDKSDINTLNYLIPQGDFFLREYRLHKNLEWWYNNFAKFKQKERILKYIQKNLLT